MVVFSVIHTIASLGFPQGNLKLGSILENKRSSLKFVKEFKVVNVIKRTAFKVLKGSIVYNI